MCRDSLILVCLCVSWPIDVCDKKPSYLWLHLKFIRMCVMTHSCVDSFMCVMSLIQQVPWSSCEYINPSNLPIPLHRGRRSQNEELTGDSSSLCFWSLPFPLSLSVFYIFSFVYLSRTHAHTQTLHASTVQGVWFTSLLGFYYVHMYHIFIYIYMYR